MDEKSLALRASQGDKEAFAALYMLYRDDLYRYAYYKLGSSEDARDAVSECIVSAFESIGSLRSAGSFKPWIFRILYRSCAVCIAQQSEQSGRADISELDKLPSEDSGISAELKEAFGVLSPQDRDIVLLSSLGGYNSREISAMTGIGAVTVRSRLSRSLKKMRSFLE